MAGDVELGRPAGMQAERTAEESARPAWAKPVVRRFSLQRTLAGSGPACDLSGAGSSTVSAC